MRRAAVPIPTKIGQGEETASQGKGQRTSKGYGDMLSDMGLPPNITPTFVCVCVYPYNFDASVSVRGSLSSSNLQFQISLVEYNLISVSLNLVSTELIQFNYSKREFRRLVK